MRLLAALRALRPGILGPPTAAPLVTVLLVAALLVAGSHSVALATDPTSAPARPPTCAERYPDEGPAGVDLRLGCVIGEVIDQYTGSVGATATPASSYALVALAILVAGFVAIWLIGRFARGALGRRLAPVRPDEWWLCPACRSVNGAGVQHCYSCRTARPEGAAQTLPTDDTPATTQSFGNTRKRG